jgi:hypothetical protein
MESIMLGGAGGETAALYACLPFDGVHGRSQLLPCSCMVLP